MFTGYYPVPESQAPPDEGEFYITLRVDNDRLDALLDALLLDTNPIIDQSNFDALSYRISLSDPLTGTGTMIYHTLTADTTIDAIALFYDIEIAQNDTLTLTADAVLIDVG